MLKIEGIRTGERQVEPKTGHKAGNSYLEWLLLLEALFVCHKIPRAWLT
jgi:hypothetical protein